MATATFYELPPTLLTPIEQRRAVCRVVAKAWQVMGEACVLCPDPETARELDDLLWTFQAGSFIPHAMGGDEAPVRLYVAGETLPDDSRVWVLLTADLPRPLPRCERLVDFIPADPEGREAARNRYRAFKAAGHELLVYPLEA